MYLPMLSQAEAQVQVAQITGLVTILVIVVSALVARFITRPKTPKTDPDANRKDKNESLLATYSGDQNEFMHLVIQDSKDLHKRMGDMESIVDTMKKERTQIVGAFGRYILKLANAWGSGGEKMPYPDTEDLAILEETLPANWRRGSKH